VNVLTQGCDSRWELGLVLNDLMSSNVSGELPAVIQIDIIVSLGC